MTELWDVTDEDGVPTGETYRRGAPDWPVGRFHVVVATCVVRSDGAVLLTQRAAGKEFPFGWELPGGSALAGETSVDAASRELREETGVPIRPGDLSSIGRFTETTALVDLYAARAPDRVLVEPDASEVAAYEWVGLDDVERRLRAGMMAEPWNARLGALGAPLAAAVAVLAD